MIPPKDSQIDAASGTFGTDERARWLPILAGSNTYRLAAPNFHDLPARLVAVVTGTIQAKQLNAAYKLIGRLGSLDASIDGREGKYSIKENREGLIIYALAVLYGADFIPRFIPFIGSSRVRNRAIW